MRQDRGMGPALSFFPALGCSQGLTNTTILEETHFRSESQAMLLSEQSHNLAPDTLSIRSLRAKNRVPGESISTFLTGGLM